MKNQPTRQDLTSRRAASGRLRAPVLSWSHAAVFLLLNMSVGLETPVLSLMLLARGATLETLPLVMGVTLVVTAVCEVPSGIAADSWGRRRLFCGVKDLDCTEPEEDKAMLERLITFEGVFILLGQTVKMYDTQHPSAGNKELLERLGSVFNALLNHDWKACPVAKDYYRHAPKLVSYSFEQAWETITGFLERNADGLGAHAFLAAISESNEVENVCHRIYNASVGL